MIVSPGSRISKNLRKEKEKRNRKSNVPVVDLFVDFFVFGAIYRFARRKACALLSSWKCAVISSSVMPVVARVCSHLSG